MPDCKLLDATIEAVVIERPAAEEGEQNLCLDAGYDNPSGRAAVEKHGYVGHIRPVYEDKRPKRPIDVTRSKFRMGRPANPRCLSDRNPTMSNAYRPKVDPPFKWMT